MQKTDKPGCTGLYTEALVAGKTIIVPKHSPVIEAYGYMEEAEALIARARMEVPQELVWRLERIQRAIRLLPAVLAGAIKPEDAVKPVIEAGEGLDEPGGWSLTGCGPGDPDIVLASVKLRAAERSISKAVEEGLVPRDLAEQLSAIITMISYTLYTIHWKLCSIHGGVTARESRGLLAN
ncbi:ATP:cob(I)alamin adenosyltransferase [Hyperthermus butylicus]|uniref:Cobalamin adenosyltransferase n=1 Tax=Hyperthermus butylicus (strain DSM 5456 / JCM 9403 / PLM1-5) TaxID=415426 RepID=A2BKN4_HYPBU|nr:ATP:cob(I)alamin adenosyltransferase [Hyperthermus butylicus]ABM80545.1 Cobalamin adenosyltransferase [Hyperthermus butylicus DSM 5456]